MSLHGSQKVGGYVGPVADAANEDPFYEQIISLEPLHAQHPSQSYFVAPHHSYTDRVHQDRYVRAARRAFSCSCSSAMRVARARRLSPLHRQYNPGVSTKEKRGFRERRNAHVAISPASLTSCAHPSARARASKVHSVHPRASYVSCNPRSPLSRCCLPPSRSGLPRCGARGDVEEAAQRAEVGDISKARWVGERCE